MKRLKTITSLVLCVLMLSALCFSASAKTLYPVGDWVYEKINDDTQFEVDEYVGSATTVITPVSHNNIPITSIGEYAFDSNTTLKTISLRSPITAVQNFAFTGCSNLNRVILNSGVNYIGAGAFFGCKSLTNINLDKSTITAIDNSTFSGCASLSEITLPDTVKSIGHSAFSSCASLNKIVIPASVTSIGDNVFKDSDNVVIYCYTDSVAHKYAVDNNISYYLLDATFEGYYLGDADDDGKVTVLDATLLQRLLANLVTDDDGKIAIRGNVDADELLSIMDATLIQRFVASYDDGLSIGQPFNY